VEHLADSERARAAPAEARRPPLSVYLGAFLALYGVSAFAAVLFVDPIVVPLAGLAILLVGTLLLYRSMTKPLRALSDAMGRGAERLEPELVTASGPAEIARVAARFNALVASVDTEIAERRHAEAAARVSERNYRLLFEGNPQPLVVYDVETLNVLEVNDAAIKLYGYARDEFISRPAADLIPTDQAGWLVSASIKRLPDLHDAGPGKHRAKDGNIIDVNATSIRLVYDGHDARLVLVEDLTERKGLEGQLQQSRRLDTVGQLAGGIAHDFNNLLAVILNYADFVADELPQGELRRDVEEIQRAAMRAADLTRQLLIFARREVTNPQVLDLNAVVAGVENLLRRTIGEDVELLLKLADDLPCVRADPGQIEQVFLNLTLNARDAMPRGGQLVVETSAVELGTAEPGRPDVSAGRYVRLSVSDTGVGMSEAVAARAFEPFFTTKAAGQGTGLGLATVYGIVAGAGGNISIDSEVGRGTRVSINLPANDEPAAELIRPVAPTAIRSGDGRTVLIVEDENAVLVAAVRILNAQGYKVLARSDPTHALDVLGDRETAVDILVTDVVMPRLAGVDLAHRAHELRPGLPILFISGYAPSLVDDGGALPAGSNILRKPFTRLTLLQAIGEALGDAERDG
jgi:two-component system cell cycle sensor histidine kinase/response regulator CckA